MSWLLGILSVLVFLIGLGAWSASTTVIHEILAGVLFIISAIFLSAAAIVGAITSFKEKFLDMAKPSTKKPVLWKEPESNQEPKKEIEWKM